MILPQPATPTAAYGAIQHTTRFDAVKPRYFVENRNAFVAAMATFLVGQGSTREGLAYGGGLSLLLRTNQTYNIFFGSESRQPTQLDYLAINWFESFARLQDQGPVASLYLAIRSARQGLESTPDDVLSQFYLAEAYHRLQYETRENYRTSVFGAARIVRQTQIAAAFQNVLKVEPTPHQARTAHALLQRVFGEPQFFEVSVKHAKDAFRLTRLTGPPPNVDPKQALEYFQAMDKQIKALDEQLKQRRDRYEVESANRPLLEKAQRAMQLGLAETALNLLMNADPKELSDPNHPGERQGAVMIVSLLLGLGRVDDANLAMTGDPKSEAPPDKRSFGMHPMGIPAYSWFQVQMRAATGDYEGADKALADCLEDIGKSPVFSRLLNDLDIIPPRLADKDSDRQTFSAMLVGHLFLQEASLATGGFSWPILRQLPLRMYRLNPPDATRAKQLAEILPLNLASQFLHGNLEQEANLWTLRAWLALEAGKLERATEFSVKALQLGEIKNEDGSRLIIPFSSRPLADLVRELSTNKLRRN
jgi:tetratricopeptide (TPR) repeat protein